MVDMSEAYYVISGDGYVTVDNETAAIKVGDAIPVDLGQSKSFTAGTAPLEMMVVGVARDIRTKNAFAAVGGKRELTACSVVLAAGCAALR
jgi:mannose-6-phosphate isomerase-like protein (cupin superfamily)